MRVLHIINSLDTGGAEKLLVDNIPLFRKKGMAVDLLLLKAKRTMFWSELENNSPAKIIGLSTNSIYNPFLLFKIIPFFKQYDIIHSHLFPTLYWVVLARWISFSKVKLIYTEHNTSNRRRSNKLFAIIDRFIYNGLDYIITIGDEVDDKLKAHLRFNHQKFHLIRNGIDTKVFSNAGGYQKEDFFVKNDTILIQVSSFRRQKDQNTLIRSLLYLPDNIKLLLVGEGELLDDSKNLVKRLNLSDRIKFLGNRNDVAKLLNTSDIVILSSNYEGASLSNIEGMSAGKPFIGSDVPGLREIVKNHGLLFQKGNEKNLAMQITNLLANPCYYNEIASGCLARAKEFNSDKMIADHIRLYNKVLVNDTNLDSIHAKS